MFQIKWIKQIIVSKSILNTILPAQEARQKPSQFVKSAVKNGPTLILKFYYLIYTAQETVQGTRYKGHTNIPPPEAEKVSN